MRLTRLVMHGFRSYREPVEVRFEPGVNVFLGRNEAGKTGILLAIQAALYSPRTAAEREVLVAAGSDVCQVALEYMLPDGSEFRVDRDLVGHRGSIAECREGGWLTLATSVGDIARIVREHTGCDDALFRATLLVRHEGIEVGDADDLTRSLSERIELLVSGSPGGVSAARAVKKLADSVKELSGPRAGLIAAGEGRLREAESVLASAGSAMRRLADGKPRLEELSERSRLLEAELADAEAVLERARRVAGLESRRAELQSGRAAIDRALDARAELEQLESAAVAARGRAPIPVIVAPAAPPSGMPRIPLLVLGALLLLGGAAALLGQVLLGIGLGLLGAAVAATGWFLGSRRVESKPRVAALDAEAERLAREAERRRDLAEGAARSLDQRPEAELSADRSRLGRDLDEVEAALREAAIHRLEPAELARREARAQQLPAVIRAADEARLRCEIELQSLESAAPSLAELEDEVEVARRDVDRLKLRLDAMRLAREELEAAIQDIRQGVGPELAAEASNTLSAVAPDYRVALAAGSGLTFLPADPGGGPLGRRQLSDGTLDQFHFAVRVALAGVLLGDLRPPLLLDDPFRYADGERRAALHAMLSSIGQQRQVLYFTVEEPTSLAVTHRLPVVASRVGSE
ncbi:MAG: AAA family ATPase [Candidatus Dormibacteraeota bacterium]|nr:AAA family ATPase [Candidatus Dormibacteraeota bacterium]